jgi:hypothetical protein
MNLLCVAVVVVVAVVDVVAVVLRSVGQGKQSEVHGQQAACSNVLTKNILLYFYKALFSGKIMGGFKS